MTTNMCWVWDTVPSDWNVLSHQIVLGTLRGKCYYPTLQMRKTEAERGSKTCPGWFKARVMVSLTHLSVPKSSFETSWQQNLMCTLILKTSSGAPPSSHSTHPLAQGSWVLWSWITISRCDPHPLSNQSVLSIVSLIHWTNLSGLTRNVPWACSWRYTMNTTDKVLTLGAFILQWRPPVTK